jgi:hypothetical protein
VARRPAPPDFLVPVTVHLPRDVYAELHAVYLTHATDPSKLAAVILTDTIRKARASRQAAATPPVESPPPVQ